MFGLMRRATYNDVVAVWRSEYARLAKELARIRRYDDKWRCEYLHEHRLHAATRETAAEQALVIEELRARLARFERVKGPDGRFVAGVGR